MSQDCHQYEVVITQYVPFMRSAVGRIATEQKRTSDEQVVQMHNDNYVKFLEPCLQGGVDTGQPRYVYEKCEVPKDFAVGDRCLVEVLQ